MKKIHVLSILILLSLSFFACSPQKRLARLPIKKYIEKQYEELKNELPEAQVTLLNDTIKVLFPNNLLFDVSSSTLSTTTNPLMERFAKSVNKFTKTFILIVGHTDNTGSATTNEALSKERSESVKGKLLSLEVASERLSSWGMGDRNPLVPNDSEKNKALNRRVEFIILAEASQFKR